MEQLAHGWLITDWKSYLIDGALLQLGVRIFISALSAIEFSYASNQQFWLCFYRSLKGVYPDDPSSQKSDYWLGSMLGLLELYSYPVLMATGAWTVIGAWLGFKTIAQWKTWQVNRVTFNRYLIGNAVVVLLSLLVLVPFVKIIPTPQDFGAAVSSIALGHPSK